MKLWSDVRRSAMSAGAKGLTGAPRDRGTVAVRLGREEKSKVLDVLALVRRLPWLVNSQVCFEMFQGGSLIVCNQIVAFRKRSSGFLAFDA